MKATVSGLGALVVMLALCGGARADHPYFFGCGNRLQAPDACGPGFICTNYYGAPYGPNYNLRPAWPPYNGALPPPDWGNNGGAFGNHPYARSPRDYFMLDLH
jgi:hypothetical protein